jgi:hypothetical protein
LLVDDFVILEGLEFTIGVKRIVNSIVS